MFPSVYPLPLALIRLQHQANSIQHVLCFPTVTVNRIDCFEDNILVFQCLQACSKLFRLGGIPFDEPCNRHTPHFHMLSQQSKIDTVHDVPEAPLTGTHTLSIASTKDDLINMLAVDFAFLLRLFEKVFGTAFETVFLVTLRRLYLLAG